MARMRTTGLRAWSTFRAPDLAVSVIRAIPTSLASSIPGWAGKTAYDLVTEGKADKVLAYLEAVHSGVYA